MCFYVTGKDERDGEHMEDSQRGERDGEHTEDRRIETRLWDQGSMCCSLAICGATCVDAHAPPVNHLEKTHVMGEKQTHSLL